MKKLFTSLFTAVCLIAAGTAHAQEANRADQMKAWQEYMTPGEVHKMLAKSEGKWKTETTMWMAPGADPMKTTGTAINRMILGGRYQESISTGKMMGRQFEGRSVVGYDNAKKVFTSIWMDNMGTGTLVMEGAWDKATNTITFKGKMYDPMSGQDLDVRETFRPVNDNMQVLEMFVVMPTGGEMKSMEITFTRMDSGKKS